MAVIIAGDVARADRDTGARQRLETLTSVASEACKRVLVLDPSEWKRAPDDITLVVGQSWSTLRTIKRLSSRSSAVWFDACDSTLALRGSTARTNTIPALAALARDITISRQFRPDLVTYITASDAARDKRLWSVEPLVLPIRWTRYRPRELSGPRRIVLAGDGTYAPNQEAAVWALKAFIPALRALEVRHHLWIYGQGYILPPAPGVHLAGYEPDATALYQRGDIHIAPIKSGAGMNSKVALPLLAGLDVVTTPLGITGLVPTSRTTVCELEEFASVVANQITTPAAAPLELSLDQILRRDDTSRLLSQLQRLIAVRTDS